MDIVIFDDDNNPIYEKSVEKSEVLLAREDKYINTEIDGEKIDEGILVSAECIYWKYLKKRQKDISDIDQKIISIYAKGMTTNSKVFYGKI